MAEGARTSIWLATSPEVEGQSGGYYYQCTPVTERMRTAVSSSEEAAAALWAAVSKDLGLDPSLQPTTGR